MIKGKGLVLDFETVDPYLSRDLGPGWVYKVHNPKSPFRCIGFSYMMIGGWGQDLKEQAIYRKVTLETIAGLEGFLRNCDYIVFHNAPYDLGCLRSLGIDISKLRVFDTKVMALLYDNTLESTGLGDLSKKFLPTEKRKETERLYEAVIELSKKGLTPFKRKVPDSDNPSDFKSPEDYMYGLVPEVIWGKRYIQDMTKWAYQHMDVIQEHCY